MSEHSERVAFTARIEADFARSEPCFLACVVFADFLDERGESEFAAGLRAMARLRVTCRPDMCLYGGVDGFGLHVEPLVRSRRAGGLYYVTTEWRARALNRRGRDWGDGESKELNIPFANHLEYTALAWGDLSPAQQERAEALLGEPLRVQEVVCAD